MTCRKQRMREERKKAKLKEQITIRIPRVQNPSATKELSTAPDAPTMNLPEIVERAKRTTRGRPKKKSGPMEIEDRSER